MLKETHVVILGELLKDANIKSVVPLEGVCKCGIFYNEGSKQYLVTGFNIEYLESEVEKLE